MKPNAITHTHVALNLLMEAAVEIIRLKTQAATGKLQKVDYLKYTGRDKVAQAEVLEIATPILQKVTELHTVEANNMSEVLGLLQKGKISIDDAKALTGIMAQKFEIEELPKLVARIESGRKA